MSLPEHFFISECDGNLYDTRKEAWHKRPPLRSNYRHTHRHISSAADLKATLRAGQYAWPGGYQMYFISNDGYAVSFNGVLSDFRTQLAQVKGKALNRIVAVDINYEDTDLYCDITGELIPASYGE
jgi:hypothetical protein